MANVPDIPVEELSNWGSLTAGAKAAGGVPPSYMYDYTKRYGITTWKVAGRTLYYLPDCERVGAIIAKKQAEKAARAEASE